MEGVELNKMQIQNAGLLLGAYHLYVSIVLDICVKLIQVHTFYLCLLFEYEPPQNIPKCVPFSSTLWKSIFLVSKNSILDEAGATCATKNKPAKFYNPHSQMLSLWSISLQNWVLLVVCMYVSITIHQRASGKQNLIELTNESSQVQDLRFKKKQRFKR